MLARRYVNLRPVAVAAVAAAAVIAIRVPPADARPPDVAAPMLSLGDKDSDSLGSELARPRSAVCERLVALSARLGETYAGYRLRTSLLAQNCPLTSGRRIGQFWSWPWQALLATPVVTAAIAPAPASETDDFLPPRVRFESGAWQIRCGRAGPRERCALTRGAATGTSLHAHFVIDHIAGKSAVVFRLLAPAAPEKTTAVRIDLARQHSVRVAVAACSPRGCLAEASPAISARLLDALWDGTPLSLWLEGGPETASTTARARTIAADGFRDAFRHLQQLERDDRHR